MPGLTTRRAGATTGWPRREGDVARDTALANSRVFGGTERRLDGDRGSATGTGVTGIYVGRIAGDDLGDARETGAEARTSALRAAGRRRRCPGGSRCWRGPRWAASRRGRALLLAAAIRASLGG